MDIFSQNPNDYLFHDTVLEELEFSLQQTECKATQLGLVRDMLNLLQLEHCAGRDPRSLSGGEKQRVALGCVLIKKPEVLLVDEPTRGLDRALKTLLGNLLREFIGRGAAILLVTQDIDFAAEYADRVGLLHQGELLEVVERKTFFDRTMFYTPTVRRLFRGIAEGLASVEEAVALLQQTKEVVQ